MSQYLISAAREPDESGRILSVTPESAQWKYVGFEVYRLRPGQTLSQETGNLEACVVLLSGKADVSAGDEVWTGIGRRMSVFEKTPPYAVYVPSGTRFTVGASTELELAICRAPGRGTLPPRLIAPEAVGVEHRGSGSMGRLVHNILPEQEPADSLLVVEVFTPGGHWSSYPPHKHDRDALPEESLLEETYYFRIAPEQGFALQRIYTEDLSIDETLTVRDSQTVLVPKGYHPVSAPPGYEVYYLNVMAGPHRTWKFFNDPGHAWLMGRQS